jgi:hypothetical protein
VCMCVLNSIVRNVYTCFGFTLFSLRSLFTGVFVLLLFWEGG